MSKIRTDQAGSARTCQGKSEIARSAAEVEDQGIRPVKDGPQALCDSSAPKAVELQREEMVQQIVARGDTREHLTDFSRGIRFRDGPFGTSSLHRSRCFSHGVFPRRGYLRRQGAA